MTRKRDQRAYALPLALLVLVVTSMMVGPMMTRQSAQSLAVQRQLDQYQEHHGVRGLEEVIEAWLLVVQGEDMAAIVAQDPHVLDLDLGDSRVAVSLENGQSLALGDLSHLHGEERQWGQQLLRALGSRVGEALPRYVRDAGPLAVDAQVAPQQILEAVSEVVLGEVSDSIVAQILSTRADHALTRADLARIATESGIDRDQRIVFNELLTVQSDVWRIRVRIYRRSAQLLEELVSSYSGLIRLGARNRRLGRGSMFITFGPDEPN